MTRSAILLCALLTASTVSARRPPLPPAERTQESQLWLARAFVGEAGWVAARDHAGIAWVLVRRWVRQCARWPDMRFVTVVKNYAHALGFRRHGSPTPRQTWLRGLSGPDRPRGWPRGASWEARRRQWHQALERAAAWMDGRVLDPCRGKAWNWGGAIDLSLAKSKRLHVIDCGETRNTFYDDGPDRDG